jgi:hypothetical protein
MLQQKRTIFTLACDALRAAKVEVNGADAVDAADFFGSGQEDGRVIPTELDDEWIVFRGGVAEEHFVALAPFFAEIAGGVHHGGVGELGAVATG